MIKRMAAAQKVILMLRQSFLQKRNEKSIDRMRRNKQKHYVNGGS